jgi:hypothetical protein
MSFVVARSDAVLLWKAWYESRLRFLAFLVCLSWYAIVIVRTAATSFPPATEPLLPYSLFVWRAMFRGPAVPLFLAASLFAGLGGIARERAAGPVLLTLSLPISRARVAVAHLAVMGAQIAVLAATPILIVAWFSAPVAGHVYAVGDAVPFVFLFASGGVLVGVVTFAGSCVVASEYVSLAASLSFVLVSHAMAVATPLRRYPALDLLNVISGSQLPYFDATTGRVTELPWFTLGLLWALTTAVGFVAVGIIERQEF